MNGLILAAGRGRRLGRLSDERPKVLLEVGGRTLLGWACATVRGVGCDDIVVVGGYRFDDVCAYVRAHEPDVRCVENTSYEQQNLVSFARGIDALNDDDVFVANSDYVFAPRVIARVRDELDRSSVQVVCSSDVTGLLDDVMKVAVRDGEYCAMSKTLEQFDMVYTGMFFIPAAQMPRVRRIVREVARREDPMHATVELLFDALVRDGASVHVIDVGEASWFEVDTPEEYEAAVAALPKQPSV